MMSFTRRARVFWITSVVFALLVGVAIGVTASIDFGGEDATDSALADGQATSAQTRTSTPEAAPPSSVPFGATPSAPKAPPEPIVFTGQGGKATGTFSIEAQRFTVRWTTDVDDPGAFFFLSVFQEGQGFPVAEASFGGSGSDSTVVRAGPGAFYIEVVTGAAWRIEVTPG